MTLPLLISVPHGGHTIPPRLLEKCLLSERQIIKDGDEFAQAIYAPLESEVASYISTDIARAVLDMNRTEDDLRRDGVVKTHTCWNEPIWKESLTEEEARWLIDTYHLPYHQRLSEQAKRTDLLLAVDCHTMAANGPPVGPDPGQERPQVCLGNVNGKSCPDEWLSIMQDAFRKHFSGVVTVNEPFSGGYITKAHGKEMPWLQLELSRGNFATPWEKSSWVLSSLKHAVERIKLL
ncbi:MAG: N-formylglutamate amidohydrolase [Candidatus Thiodiazotropha sp.]